MCCSSQVGGIRSRTTILLVRTQTVRTYVSTIYIWPAKRSFFSSSLPLIPSRRHKMRKQKQNFPFLHCELPHPLLPGCLAGCLSGCFTARWPSAGPSQSASRRIWNRRMNPCSLTLNCLACLLLDGWSYDFILFQIFQPQATACSCEFFFLHLWG